MKKNKKLVAKLLLTSFTFCFYVSAQGQALPGPDPLQMEDAPDLGYYPVPHGMKIPPDVELGAASSVVWTKENHLILFNRGPNPLMEFDPRGRLLKTWGQGDYIRPHGMRLDPDGNIWTTDVNGHTVRKMNLDGQVLLTIGKMGKAGEPEAVFMWTTQRWAAAGWPSISTKTAGSTSSPHLSSPCPWCT